MPRTQQELRQHHAQISGQAAFWLEAEEHQQVKGAAAQPFRLIPVAHNQHLKLLPTERLAAELVAAQHVLAPAAAAAASPAITESIDAIRRWWQEEIH